MATFTSLYKMRIFNFEDVLREMNLSHAGTSTAISRWQSQKVLKPIRRNMYVTVDPSTDAPMCDKFELSSKISESHMLVGTLLLNYMELPTNLSTMPMLAAKAVSKILLLKE